jgi:phage FluMu protein Com
VIRIRCPSCARYMGEYSGKANIKCPRCAEVIEIDTENGKPAPRQKKKDTREEKK